MSARRAARASSVDRLEVGDRKAGGPPHGAGLSGSSSRVAGRRGLELLSVSSPACSGLRNTASTSKADRVGVGLVAVDSSSESLGPIAPGHSEEPRRLVSAFFTDRGSHHNGL